MKNNLSFILKSKISINVVGNNIERFIKRLKSNKIDILSLKKISNNEVNIKIYKKDYDKLLKIKTIYEFEVLDYYGSIKLKKEILNNKIIIILILLFLIIIYILSNIIFYVDIVTNDSKMKNTLNYELTNLGLKKYTFKKSYLTLQSIKKKILDNHKEELEWIEIENIGTKYIIRYEPRIINKEKTVSKPRNIIAKKDAVIKSLNISKGEIIKDVNSYVKKGDVIVSGYVKLNESVKDTIISDGTVLGLVWYNVCITYPYKYNEEYETGNKKIVYVIKFLNREIELFNFNKYKTKKVENNILLKNNLLPIAFIRQNQSETNVIKDSNNEKDIIKRAIELSNKKIEKSLDDFEYIKDYKILNKTNNSDSITLNIFYEVVEDITEYQDIEENLDIQN
ncbi:MAG: sporulation protein YqfD [bacterium]|nr:sporulation protein YqfD [bacterium]